MSRTFIFGYGSLISSDSRSRTGSPVPAYPVRVRGFKRGWYIINSDHFYASVAIIPFEGSICSGVLFEVSESDLLKFDRRESGYQRVPVPIDTIDFLSAHQPVVSAAYTYCVSEIERPDSMHPIPLSYLDVIIHGCLEYGEEFAREFVATTDCWESPWIDDTQYPIYVRPLESSIDRNKLLSIYRETLSLSEKVDRKTYLHARVGTAK